MRSLIILEVEHDEGDDPMVALSLCDEGLGGSDFILEDYTIHTDIPECFRLDK